MNSSKIIRSKSFYTTFFALCIPIMLQNMISLSVNLADNLMLGRYAESSLSGVTAVNQIQFIYQQLINGAGDGLIILASQYWGKRKTEEMKKIASIALWTGLAIMAVLFVLVSLFPSQAVGIFTNDPDIIVEGVKYLHVIRFTYPFFCITTVLLALLQSAQIVRIALALSCSTLCINCSINWMLIYGNLGMPRLGVTGAAIGTLIARIVELIILILYLAIGEKKLNLSLKDLLFLDRPLAHDYYKVTLPVIFLKSLWGFNTAAQTAILGHLSSAAIAANSMASNLYLMVKTMATGEASATGIIIGKAIGKGKSEEELRTYARTFQILFVGIGILCGLVLFAISEPVLSLYTFSDEARSLARAFLQILCIVMVGMCYQMPVNNGIIKGGGDTQFVVKMDIISIWCIVIPLSLVAAFVWNASPVIVIICLNLDQIFKCLPAFLKANYGHWMKRLAK